MIDDLINVSGSFFLTVFTVYAIIIICIIKRYVNKDYSEAYEIPEPTKLEPLDIAILANGEKGAINTAMFNLWRCKGADISVDKNSIILKQKPTDTSKLNKLEEIIYNYIQQPKYYRDLYNESLLKSIDEVLQPNKSRLKELHLIPDSRVIKHHWKGILYGVLLLIGFEGIKLYLEIVIDKPFDFLKILSIIALFVVIKPTKIRTTALGKKLLDKTQQRFAWVKSSNKSAELLRDDNLLYGIAIFGMSSFIGSDFGELIGNPVFLDKQFSSSGYGFGDGCAGCGGGYDEGDYGDGDSGDDGGGCSGCGGGCGGCGGD